MMHFKSIVSELWGVTVTFIVAIWYVNSSKVVAISKAWQYAALKTYCTMLYQV